MSRTQCRACGESELQLCSWAEGEWQLRRGPTRHLRQSGRFRVEGFNHGNSAVSETVAGSLGTCSAAKAPAASEDQLVRPRGLCSATGRRLLQSDAADRALRVLVAGGGPVGLIFAIVLKHLMGDRAAVRVFDHRWHRKNGRIEWRGSTQGNVRRKQVNTLNNSKSERLAQHFREFQQ